MKDPIKVIQKSYPKAKDVKIVETYRNAWVKCLPNTVSINSIEFLSETDITHVSLSLVNEHGENIKTDFSIKELLRD